MCIRVSNYPVPEVFVAPTQFPTLAPSLSPIPTPRPTPSPTGSPTTVDSLFVHDFGYPRNNLLNGALTGQARFEAGGLNVKNGAMKITGASDSSNLFTGMNTNGLSDAMWVKIEDLDGDTNGYSGTFIGFTSPPRELSNSGWYGYTLPAHTFYIYKSGATSIRAYSGYCLSLIHI